MGEQELAQQPLKPCPFRSGSEREDGNVKDAADSLCHFLFCNESSKFPAWPTDFILTPPSFILSDLCGFFLAPFLSSLTCLTSVWQLASFLYYFPVLLLPKE